MLDAASGRKHSDLLALFIYFVCLFNHAWILIGSWHIAHIQDRSVLQSLYEDWCQSGEDWCQSATYMRSVEKKSSKKRGKMCYRTFLELQQKFGVPVAKQIRDTKYDLEKSRAPHEQPFWLPHPEVKGNKDRLGHQTKNNPSTHTHSHTHASTYKCTCTVASLCAAKNTHMIFPMATPNPDLTYAFRTGSSFLSLTASSWRMRRVRWWRQGTHMRGP